MKPHLTTILAAFLLLAASGCGKNGVAAGDEHGHEETGHEEAGHEAEGGAEAGHLEDIVLAADAIKIAGIETEGARMVPMQAELKVPGTVTNTSHGRAVVTPPVDGKIVRFGVKVGDTVRAGQAIATLQSADLAEASAATIDAQRGVMAAQAAVREAKAEVDLAHAKLRTANANLRRQQEFARTGAFSQPALQQAQKELNEAQAELESSQQEEVVHEAQLERAERLYKQELISRTELEQARLELQQDKTKQANARRQIEIARATYERERTISERGLTNSREIQTAEAEVRAANIEVQQMKIRQSSAVAAVAGAEKGLLAARTSYAALAGGGRAGGGSVTVVAPISGVVTHREATLGQAVERTTEIAEIENNHSVWVTANVPEKQAGLARKGSRAQVRVSAFPNLVFTGVVQVVGSRLDVKSRTLPVQVLVDNASGSLRPAMFASVSLGVGPGGVALVVPVGAVVAEGDRSVVYLAEEGNRFEEREVVTGRRLGDLVEVVSGLEAGQKVVSKGGFILKSEKVKGELKGHEH